MQSSNGRDDSSGTNHHHHHHVTHNKHHGTPHILPPHPTPPHASASSAPASSKGWFGWLGSSSHTSANHTAAANTSIGPSASNNTNRTPMQRCGEPTLDAYAVSIDSMQTEVSDVRSRFLQFAEQIIRMSEGATNMAELARKVASDVPLDPIAMMGFVEAHLSSSHAASTLFRDEFELEVLEPLDMWQEEAEQFLRELQRTALAWSKSEYVRQQVDRLLLQAAECEDGELSVEDELTLKLAKTDLGEACTNYSTRCQGLKRHFEEIQTGRAQALDVAFTRFMAQQSFLLRPQLRIVEQQILSDGNLSLLSPSGSSTAAMTASPSGRSRFHSGAGLSGTPRRKGTLEEDIIRMSRRVNRKNYLSHTHHYHSGMNASGSSAAPASGWDHDIHSSLLKQPGPSRSSLANWDPGMYRRGSLTRMTQEDSAILEACRQLQSEILSRKSTEEANEALRKQLEDLRAESGGVQASLAAQIEIEALKRKLQEREEALGGKVTSPKPSPSPKESDAIVSAPDAPPAPSLDAPMAPPMDAPPPPPGPPGAPSFGAGRKVLTAREKEIEDARLHGLPVLPNVEDLALALASPTSDPSNAKPLDPKDRPTLKKLHWHALTPDEVVSAASNNVWKELWIEKVGGNAKPPSGTKDQQLVVATSHPPITGTSELASLVAPIVPAADSRGHDATDHSNSVKATSDAFHWRWALDLPSFTQSFAQKATKAMAKKKGSEKPNKYAMGRKAAKDAGLLHTDDGDEESSTDAADVEESDPNDPSSPSGSTSTRNTGGKKKQLPKIDLLDAKRSYNVSISLSHFKLSAEVLRDAIMSFDEKGILREKGDLLDGILLDLLPTPDESKLIQDFLDQGGDATRLGDVEQFFLTLSVTGLSERLKVLCTIQSFHSSCSILEDLLECVHVGFLTVMKNQDAIMIFLGLVLRVGNLMNTSALVPMGSGAQKVLQRQQKQIYGFSVLPTLQKLRAVKTLDNSDSLLGFLYDYIEAQCPLVSSSFLSMLDPLRDCARVEQAFVQMEFKALGQALQQMKKLLDEDERRMNDGKSGDGNTLAKESPTAAIASSPLPSPTSPASLNSPVNMAGTMLLGGANIYIPLPPSVAEFYQGASVRLTSLQSQLSLLQTLFQDLTSYYLVSDSNTIQWESFLGSWISFVADWSSVAEQREESRLAAEKKVRQAKAAEALQQRREEAAKQKLAQAHLQAQALANYTASHSSSHQTDGVQLNVTVPSPSPLAAAHTGGPSSAPAATSSTTVGSPQLNVMLGTPIPSATATTPSTSTGGASTQLHPAPLNLGESPLQNMSALSARAARSRSPSPPLTTSRSLGQTLLRFITPGSKGSKPPKHSTVTPMAGTEATGNDSIETGTDQERAQKQTQ